MGLETELERENGTNLQLGKGESLSVLLELEGSAKICSEMDAEAWLYEDTSREAEACGRRRERPFLAVWTSRVFSY